MSSDKRAEFLVKLFFEGLGQMGGAEEAVCLRLGIFAPPYTLREIQETYKDAPTLQGIHGVLKPRIAKLRKLFKNARYGHEF